MKRVIILNGLPPNAFFVDSKVPVSYIQVWKTNIDSLLKGAKEADEVISYVRHPATSKVIQSLLKSVSMKQGTGLYKYEPGDIVYVVTLKKPVRGQEVTDVAVDDLLVCVVNVGGEEVE